MAVVPDPKKLLLPDPDAIPSVLSDKFFPICSTLFGVGSITLSRLISRRPALSGIQHHILGGIIGAAFGIFCQRRYDAYNMERDAIYMHYIELHPEDFPMPERKKVGEIFPEWTPIR